MIDLAIALENRPGALARMGEALGRAGVSIEGGGAWVAGGEGVAHFLFEDGAAARAALESAGIRVLAERDVVVQRLKQGVPGQLGLLTRRMADAGVNIEVLYSDHDHRLILVVDDVARGRAVAEAWAREPIGGGDASRAAPAPGLPPNRSFPPGTIVPVLDYADVRVAAAWLCHAFGFAERLRIGDHRIQLTYRGGSVVVADGGGPGAQPPARHSVMVRVDDAHAHHERARRHGARILAPPADHPFGERQYSVEDLGGHRWTFSQTIGDVDPADWGGELLENG
jgi:uncharacterized glyoxalase superfamily protein PhnB